MESAARADTSSRNEGVEEGRMEPGAGQEPQSQESPTPFAIPDFQKARSSRQVQSRYMQAPGAAALQARRRTVANHSLQRDSGHNRIPIPQTKGRDNSVRTVAGRVPADKQGGVQSKPPVVKAKSIRPSFKDGVTESKSLSHSTPDKKPSWPTHSAPTSPTRSQRTPKDTTYTPQRDSTIPSLHPPISSVGRSLETVVYGDKTTPMPPTPRSAPLMVSKMAGETTKSEWEDAIAVTHNRWLHFLYTHGKAEATMVALEEEGLKQVWGAMEATASLRQEVGELEACVGRREMERKACDLVDCHEAELAEWCQVGGPGRAVLRDALSAICGTTLRLPMVGHVTAQPQHLRAAIDSANAAFSQLESSVSALLSTAEVLSSELSLLSSNGVEEVKVVSECGGHLTDLTLAEVYERSLQAHVLQISRSGSTLS